MFALTLGDFLDSLADFVQWKARIGIERQTGKDSVFFIAGKADDAELVIDRLDTDGLQIILQIMIDKAGFAR